MLLYLTQLYRKHLSQYFGHFCILGKFVYFRFPVFDYEKFMCLLPSYRSLPALSFADFTLMPVVVALVIVSSKSWFWFPNSLPMSTAMLRRLPMEKHCRDESFMFSPYSTYHCVNQLHIFLHFLFSIIICDPWKTKLFIIMSGDSSLVLTWRCDPPVLHPDLPRPRPQVPRVHAPLRATEHHPLWTSGA